MSSFRRDLGKVVSTAQNVAEFLRFGGLETGEAGAPHTVVAEQPNYRLRHYFPDAKPVVGRPILLIPPLGMSAGVWDVSEATSAVTALHRANVDPWVVDFGDPAHEPGGLDRTMTDHILAVSDAVDRVHASTGQDVVLAGYSQGGMFAYEVAAMRRCARIDSLVTFGAPADLMAHLPIPISPDRFAVLAEGLVHSGLARRMTVPSWVMRAGFNAITPVVTLQSRVKFLLALNDRESLLPRERQRRFIESDGWTAYSGPAIAEMLEQFVARNRMVEGGFVINNRLVTLADIDVPVLLVVGDSDSFGHPDAVRAIRNAAPAAPVYEVTLSAGHLGLVIGSRANEQTWPAVGEWIRWRDGDTELPANIVPADQVQAAQSAANPVAAALTWATGLGFDGSNLVFHAARRAARAATVGMTQATTLLPRLARLGQLDPMSRVSLAAMLDELAHDHPDQAWFLFGDRAYSHAETKHRVDSVVKGLISVGIRHGDRVGVLMASRPSAFCAVAALGRVGATAVLLRPDGDVKREAGMARIIHVVCDPEHVELVDQAPTARWSMLGGGSAKRRVRSDVVDLEQIDPSAVALPDWYRANPHVSADIAFVLFRGEGSDTRAISVTSGRWAASALGTASAAALGHGDTVYSVTPYHHASALLMGVGGAVASGARFAMAGATDRDTFWAEVRRYGATHVSYTWTSLRDVALAPATAVERHHPMKMFLGSGMPSNLWHRVNERFPSVRVLEFYASTDGDAILANVNGHPVGSLGQPLPGTPEVRVAAFDLRGGNIELGDDGMARETADGEIGLLLVRVSPLRPIAPTLRGLFEPDDAWQSTGELFRRDEHGDLWRVDSASAVIHCKGGTAIPEESRRAVESLPAVDLSLAYGVTVDAYEVLVVAVSLREEYDLSTVDLNLVCARLIGGQRPKYVHVLSSLPLSPWGRTLSRGLQVQGVPSRANSLRVWVLDDRTGRYRCV